MLASHRRLFWLLQAALVLLLDGVWFGYDQLQFFLNK